MLFPCYFVALGGQHMHVVLNGFILTFLCFLPPPKSLDFPTKKPKFFVHLLNSCFTADLFSKTNYNHLRYKQSTTRD